MEFSFQVYETPGTMLEVLTKKKLAGLISITSILYLLFFLREPRGVTMNWEEKKLPVYLKSNPCTIKPDPGVHSEHWIVVTSIQLPTKTVGDLAKIPGWKLVVVGDTKTPSGWSLDGVIYLSVERQKELCYRTVAHLPFKSYTRKMVGYLYAMQHGAKYIYDTDDDNVPWDSLATFHVSDSADILTVKTDKLVFNPYSHFGQASIWPRGFPVERFTGASHFDDYELKRMQTPVIQQGLINGDPDVDAYYRMTRKNEQGKLHLKFDSVGPPVALPRKTFSPYNSQNTLFTYDGFWALLIPTSTSFRTCDIYRGYWSQPLLWTIGKLLAFYPPNSVHYRNAHSYIKDAKDETDFIRMGDLLEALKDWNCETDDFSVCIRNLTSLFVQLNHYTMQDFDLIEAWLLDLQALKYAFPKVVKGQGFDKSVAFKYYPKEMPASMPHKKEYYVSQEGGGLPQVAKFVETKCNKSVGRELIRISSEDDPDIYPDILLVMYEINDNKEHAIAMQESYLHVKHLFPRRVYCTTGDSSSMNMYQDWEMSVLVLDHDKSTEVDCLATAMKLGFIVKGYLFIHNVRTFLDGSALAKLDFNSTLLLSRVSTEEFDKCVAIKQRSLPCNSFMDTSQAAGSVLNDYNKEDLWDIELCLNNSGPYGLSVLKELIYVPQKYSALFKNLHKFSYFSIVSRLCYKYSLLPSVSNISINGTDQFCDLL